jgi:hypothetical protein
VQQVLKVHRALPAITELLELQDRRDRLATTALQAQTVLTVPRAQQEPLVLQALLQQSASGQQLQVLLVPVRR